MGGVFIYLVGDGMRVKSIMDTSTGTETTYFVGAHYQVVDDGTTQTILKYYYAGSQRIAMRTNGTLNFLLGDHLGSTSLVTDGNGQNPIETRYTAWGEIRYSSGLSPTDYTYTGQFSYTADFGLMFYNARWYDNSLGRFAQADTIIPGAGNSVAWDRYAYANNAPIIYIDPNGHDGIPWSFTLTTSMVVSAINSFGSNIGVSNLSLKTANALNGLGTVADVGAAGLYGYATLIDGIAISVGATSGVVLSPGTAPITGPAGAALGYGIAEAGTKPIQKVASSLSVGATVLTAASDILSGESYAEVTVSGFNGAERVDAQVSGFLGQDTYTSAGLTIASVVGGRNAPSSLAFQSLSCANDIGLLRSPQFGKEMMQASNNVSKIDPGLGAIFNLSGYAQSQFASYTSSHLPPFISFGFNFNLWRGSE